MNHVCVRVGMDSDNRYHSKNPVRVRLGMDSDNKYHSLNPLRVRLETVARKSLFETFTCTPLNGQ